MQLVEISRMIDIITYTMMYLIIGYSSGKTIEIALPYEYM